MRLVAAAILCIACSAPVPPTSQPNAPPILPFAAVDAGEPAMAERVAALAREFRGGISVWIADPRRRDPLYSLNPEAQVHAASLYKLAILLHVESLIEQRRLRPEDPIVGTPWTIDEALEMMIVHSENESALALIETFEARMINATVLGYGIEGLRLADDAVYENFATARGVGMFFTELSRRTLVSPAASDRMLARLERVAHRQRIPKLLPPDARVAHKIGSLVGAVHDAGVVFTPRGPRVIAVLTTDVDEPAADEVIAKIARAVWDGR